jgi:predicted AlkP superfamily phosphohydrolase/phosphomutase
MIFPDEPDLFWESVFSENSFKESVKLGETASVFLPADGDILNILKCLAGTCITDVSVVTEEKKRFINDINEFLSHSPRRVPLWKTYAEYRNFFDGKPLGNINTDPCMNDLIKKLPGDIAAELGDTVAEEDVIVIKAEAKKYAIAESDIHILINGNPKSFTGLLGKQMLSGPPPMHFFVFIPKEYESKAESIIDFLKQRTR